MKLTTIRFYALFGIMFMSSLAHACQGEIGPSFSLSDSSFQNRGGECHEQASPNEVGLLDEEEDMLSFSQVKNTTASHQKLKKQTTLFNRFVSFLFLSTCVQKTEYDTILLQKAGEIDLNLATLSNEGLTITGAGAGYQTGYSVSSAGNVNGDVEPDMLIGSNTGIVYLIYDGSNLANINLASLGDDVSDEDDIEDISN